MPVTGLEKFYGRKSELDLLRKRILDFKDGYRQNVALIGERYVGKTFLLQKFLSEAALPDLVQVYIDVEQKDIGYFCRRMAGSVLYEFSRIHHLPLHDDLNLLIESTQSSLPQTSSLIQRIQKYIHQGKKLEAYKDIIALPQVFSAETGLFCVFVFDEFHDMQDWGVPEIFQELGKVVMTQKQSLYVFSSSCGDEAKTILSEKLSLLFGNFEVIDIGALDQATCQDYIGHHLPGVTISEELRNFLIDFTGGHPLYLRLLCEAMFSLCVVHHQREVFLPVLSRAVEDVLFDPWGVLSRHFDLLMNQLCAGKGNLVNADLVIALTSQKCRVQELAGNFGVSQKVLAPRMGRLQELGIIGKSGRSFYIRDRLFRYWLRYVFRRRRDAIDIDPARGLEQFQAEFAAAIEDFRIQITKDMPVRIMELFHCFDDESIHMDGRRYKLPVFDHISLEKMKFAAAAGFHLLRASAGADEWLILLK
ncbi:MAG TPA: hypothetical protein VLJ10_06035, partial [Candidatus Bathyarchaeia archaeon]|nr:hypothetical protein [Candidatus Bathyarchaeia archaeon]